LKKTGERSHKMSAVGDIEGGCEEERETGLGGRQRSPNYLMHLGDKKHKKNGWTFPSSTRSPTLEREENQRQIEVV